MEVTEKIRDMIMSRDVELHQLVSVMLTGYCSFSYIFEGKMHIIQLPRYYRPEAVREILRYEMLKIEATMTSVKN